MAYGVFDARAEYDLDSAVCFEVCDTEAEADIVVEEGNYGDGCVVIEL